MSHVKSGGAVAQTKNMVGRSLGVKYYEGQLVKNGTIVVRQKGSVFHPGKNTKMSKDFSIFAVDDGIVKFRRMRNAKSGRYYVDVLKDIEKSDEKKIHTNRK